MIVRRCVAGVAAALVLAGAGAGDAPLTAQEEAGKRLFRQGTGVGGEPVAAVVGPKAAPIRGHLVPCANCHGIDGQGRAEGGVRPPVITWSELVRGDGHRHAPAAGGPERAHAPFDEAAFARAVGDGIDPSGNRLDPTMPRYRLSAGEFASLIAYLKRITDDHDPGVAPESLTLGTLLPHAGPLAPGARSVEHLLRAAIAATNATGGIHGRRLELIVVDAGDDAEKGLRALTEIERRGVFALLAPIAPAIEDELARFSETRGVPLVGMVAPGVAAPAPRFAWHVVGGALERAAAVAEFAVADLESGRQRPVVVLGPGRRMAAQADRIDAQFMVRGRPAPTRESLVPGRAAQLVPGLQIRGAEVVFFVGAGSDLTDFVARADEAGYRPRILVPEPVSPKVGEEAARRIYVASPLLPSDFGVEMRRALPAGAARPGVLDGAAWATASTTLEALKRAGRALSRERFQSAMQTLQNFTSGATPPLSFGGQRRVGTGGAWVLPLHPAPGKGPGSGRFVEIDRVAS